MTKFKKKTLTIPNAGKHVKQLEFSYTADRNTALVQPLLSGEGGRRGDWDGEHM